MRIWSLRLVVTTALAAGAFAVPQAHASLEVEQLPGGKYKGAVGDGKKLKLKVASNGEYGRARMRCASRKTRFAIRPDGRFKAEKRNRRGGVVFRVKGRFRNLELVRGRVAKLRGGGRHCRTGRYKARLRNVRGLERTTVRYGPYRAEPAAGEHGHRLAGPSSEHQSTPQGSLRKPCEDCYLVAMKPDLVDAAGRSRNFDNGAMLHHIVLLNRGRRDATCAGWPERFFASGNERTMFIVPAGYGYRVRPADSWAALTHVMSTTERAQQLYVEIEFWWVEASASLDAVKPFWFDIDNCSDSEYMTPAGAHTETREFTVSNDIAGAVVALGGHLHDDGVRIALANATRGQSICASEAVYGSQPAYMGHVEALTGCVGDPVARLPAGDVLRLESTYDSDRAQHDVMGIMVGYVAPSG